MKELKSDELDSIYGGSVSITGPIISGLVSIIKILKDAGYALGSGIRRFSEGKLCPLK